MTESVAFDRAAAYYDRTRALSESARAAVTEMLLNEIRGRAPTLEIGVGTGRIALPLHESGAELVGIDLSVPMLEQLVSNSGGSLPFPVANADAQRLPFRDDAFGSVVTCHVMHLIPGWRRVAEEIVRVVRPGGVYLNEMGDWGRHPLYDIVARWSELAGIELRNVGAEDQDEVAGALEAMGARPREVPEIRGRRDFTPADTIHNLTEGMWSFTWRASEDARRAASETIRPWLQEQFGDLNRTIPYEETLLWRAYDLP